MSLFSVFGCGPFPRDPEETTNRALERGALRAGVTESPPWVVRTPNGAAGIEGNLIQAFADQLGIAVEWHWGSTDQHLHKLKRYELDIVAGGLMASSPWKTEVGFTRPYRAIAPASNGESGASPSEKPKHVLAIPSGENQWLRALEQTIRESESVTHSGA